VAAVRIFCLAAAAAALVGCSRDPLVPEKFAAIRSALPAFKDRVAQGNAGSGTLERKDGKGGAVALSWDADERAGLPSDVEALLVSGFASATVAPAAEPISTHPVVEVTSGDARTLVWRCDKSRRLLRLSVNEGAAGKVDLRSVASGVSCHAIGDKPVNGEVPVVDTALLGPAWSFARRQPASASWLREDAVLTLFAGLRAPGVRDPETAAKVAPAWVQAAGLQSPKLESTTWVDGPAKHKALRVIGRAELDKRPVRFTLYLWRCLPRGKSHAALVFAQDRGGPAGVADWTGHDGALSAARCHH
jgi:hypothetical protein